MLLPVLVAARACPQFGAEDPLQPVAGSSWYHRRITQDAAAAAGWSPDAADELAWHAVGVDLYAYHPVWRLTGGPARWRGARWGREPLTRLHFDDLPTTADVEETWLRVLGGTRVALDWAARHADVGAARAAIGAGLHAIQDFYSHSTWIDAAERRGCSWLEHRGRPVPPDVATGGYGPGCHTPLVHGGLALTGRVLLRLPGLLGISGPGRGTAVADPGARPGPPPGLRLTGPDGINLDSRWQAQLGVRTRHLDGLDGDQAFELALGLAARDTRIWLAELDATVGDGPGREFWRQVRTGAGADWTRAYNAPGRLPYQFLAAGRPLPAGRGDAARWFLRIDRAGPRHGTAVVEVLDAAGTVLGTARCPEHSVTAGPLPPGAVSVRVAATGSARRLRVHAFRRAPEHVLELVLDTRLDRRSGRGRGATGHGALAAALPTGEPAG